MSSGAVASGAGSRPRCGPRRAPGRIYTLGPSASRPISPVSAAPGIVIIGSMVQADAAGYRADDADRSNRRSPHRTHRPADRRSRACGGHRLAGPVAGRRAADGPDHDARRAPRRADDRGRQSPGIAAGPGRGIATSHDHALGRTDRRPRRRRLLRGTPAGALITPAVVAGPDGIAVRSCRRRATCAIERHAADAGRARP